jgi:signal transduction histidine kinase
MAEGKAGAAQSIPSPAGVRDAILQARALFLAGLIYPSWYLLTPKPATDSWTVWFAVAGVMLVPQAAAWIVPAARPYRRSLCQAAIGVMTLQFFVLASLNRMSSFYAVGSVLMAVNAGVAYSTPRGLLLYGGLVCLVIVALYLTTLDSLMLAYWGSIPIMLFFLYWQLRRRCEAEDGLREYKAQLEFVIDERTLELRQRTRDLEQINVRLQQEIFERERAEQSLRTWQKLEALARLAGGVAHDFNNLTTAISGYATLLRDSLPPESLQRRDAEEICQAAQRAAELTHHLLAFSRRGTLETSSLDLNQILRESADLLSMASGADVRPMLDLGAGPLWIRANRTQIEQILINLADNARDAMSADGGTLHIETRGLAAGECDHGGLPPNLAGGPVVRIRVRDTGTGMDPETASRVFDPFFTTKDVDRGTGLGLAAVYGIVQQSGGCIQVESEPNRGTCFTIHWPAADQPSTENQQSADQQTEPQQAGERTPLQSILVVDDEAPLRRLVSRVLADQGYLVSCVPDAEQALLEVKRRKPIDLMLTDVVLPRISGIQLAHEVSRLRPEIRILFMSGHLAHGSLASRDLPEGAPLLGKPFPPETLLSRIRDVLRSPGRPPA